MRLTATNIRNLNPPPGKTDYVYFDDDLPGYGLRVRTTGGQTWMVQYAIAGKTRRIAFGTPATLDPGKARQIAKDLLAQVRLGRDPAGEKARGRVKAAETVGALLPRFMQRQRARLKPRSYVEVERHLLIHAKPLHGLPVEAVDRRIIAIRLAEIAEASGPAAANRVRTSLSAFCVWAAREGYVEANPVAFTNKAIENGARARVLTDDELAAIWRAAGDGQYGTIVKLLMLTGARRDEIASLSWGEVDIAAATITLPPARTKNKREHVVPLSDQACAILAAQSRHHDLVFGHGARGFQNWSASKNDIDARLGNAFAWTQHDFRRSLSTALHERFGVPPHVVEAVLGHVGGHRAGVAGTYNWALYLDERRRALQRWADHLEQLVSGTRPGVVVKLRG